MGDQGLSEAECPRLRAGKVLFLSKSSSELGAAGNRLAQGAEEKGGVTDAC